MWLNQFDFLEWGVCEIGKQWKILMLLILVVVVCLTRPIKWFLVQWAGAYERGRGEEESQGGKKTKHCSS